MQNNPLAAACRVLKNCLRRAASAARSGTVDGLGSQTFRSGQLGVDLVASF